MLKMSTFKIDKQIRKGPFSFFIVLVILSVKASLKECELLAEDSSSKNRADAGLSGQQVLWIIQTGW